MIDIDSLMKGQDYAELLDSYVLFICTQDPFQKDKDTSFGLPCYTFRNTCLENEEVSLDDKAIKVIYNASAYEKVEDEGLRDFLRYVSTNTPDENNFSKTLSETVERLKENEEFRMDYAAMNLHDRDIMKIAREEGMAQGIAEGAQQKAVEATINLLKMKLLSPEQISQAQGLPLEKVLELQKSVQVKA